MMKPHSHSHLVPLISFNKRALSFANELLGLFSTLLLSHYNFETFQIRG